MLKINHQRLKEQKRKRQESFFKYPILTGGDNVSIWYSNREKEQGVIKYQWYRGICISSKNKSFLSKITLRSITRKINMEQQFYIYGVTIWSILWNKNTVKNYRTNNLFFLRKKKNKRSKFIFQ